MNEMAAFKRVFGAVLGGRADLSKRYLLIGAEPTIRFANWVINMGLPDSLPDPERSWVGVTGVPARWRQPNGNLRFDGASEIYEYFLHLKKDSGEEVSEAESTLAWQRAHAVLKTAVFNRETDEGFYSPRDAYGDWVKHRGQTTITPAESARTWAQLHSHFDLPVTGEPPLATLPPADASHEIAGSATNE